MNLKDVLEPLKEYYLVLDDNNVIHWSRLEDIIMSKKKIEQTLQFITIDMDTWNRFCRCIMDFNKYVDLGSPESSSIKKILKKHDLRFKAGEDNEET